MHHGSAFMATKNRELRSQSRPRLEATCLLQWSVNFAVSR